MRHYFLLAILILVAAFAFWFQEDYQQQPLGVKPVETRLPDYFMDNFTTTSLDENGQPRYVLKARKMVHYDDDDSAELEQPRLSFKDEQREFTISAQRAVYYQQQNLIHLHDDVRILRQDHTAGELSIQTDYLKINTLKRIAETDQLARVSTPELKLQSMGLIYDNPQGSLKLLSRVKGTYEATP